jgi:hypothetical protein
LIPRNFVLGSNDWLYFAERDNVDRLYNNNNNNSDNNNNNNISRLNASV